MEVGLRVAGAAATSCELSAVEAVLPGSARAPPPCGRARCRRCPQRGGPARQSARASPQRGTRDLVCAAVCPDHNDPAPPCAAAPRLAQIDPAGEVVHGAKKPDLSHEGVAEQNTRAGNGAEAEPADSVGERPCCLCMQLYTLLVCIMSITLCHCILSAMSVPSRPSHPALPIGQRATAAASEPVAITHPQRPRPPAKADLPPHRGARVP